MTMFIPAGGFAQYMVIASVLEAMVDQELGFSEVIRRGWEPDP